MRRSLLVLLTACASPPGQWPNPLLCAATAETYRQNEAPPDTESWLDLASSLPLEYELTLQDFPPLFDRPVSLFVEWREGTSTELWTPAPTSSCTGRAWTSDIPVGIRVGDDPVQSKERWLISVPADPGAPFQFFAAPSLSSSAFNLETFDELRGDEPALDHRIWFLGLRRTPEGEQSWTFTPRDRPNLHTDLSSAPFSGQWTSDPPMPF